MKLLTSGLLARDRILRPLKYFKFHQNISREDEEPMFQDIKKHGQRKPVSIDEDFNLLDGYTREVMKRVGGQLDKDQKNLKNVLSQESDKWINDTRTKMSSWRQKEYVHPVMDMVAVLPKDELADMAGALVNLTSFKRHVTRGEEQTVGGPIDVAVISKGDGFIWIKRKHYFSTEYNPHFCARYFKGKAHEEEKD
ncbi:hypothetical protein LCGC14_2998920 [marine sediment metagenome]|uniref:Uncharacterized protein n=1 Tax=marine sediment metagenome TaxID=412755 RepID=A0A0F8Z982_9ZZZZ